ncbi:MAG: sensor histidine kinase [Acidimicrobiales bacterium]
MTLRLRLVLALVGLVAAGLVGFGAVTYGVYSHSQYRQLDDQLQSPASRQFVEHQLYQDLGFAPGGPDGANGGGGGGPSGPPAGTYAELVSSSGTVLATYTAGSGDQPKFPARPLAVGTRGRLFTVESTTGSSQFRVFEEPAGEPGGGGLEPGGSFPGAGNGQGGTGNGGFSPPGTGSGNGGQFRPQTSVSTTATSVPASDLDGAVVLTAAPLGPVTNALHRLVLDETAGSLVLLLLLSAGSWLILRRGLQPLERMAGTARAIAAGDLSQRVSPAGGPSEVAQLGLALNTMLDDIEGAFQEREATELRLRQFLADASHELRTPLTSIQGFAELFRLSGDHARVDLPTILRRIEQESARMKVLVEDLLLLARLDQPRQAERAPVDLAVLAADACSDAVAMAPDRPITLDAPDPVVVAGDQSHLRQAIANLVSNAVRHTPEGTAIEVRAGLVDGAAEVSVRDHGPGLDDDALAHVFDRFWQADRARVGTGAGLGLAIVSSIAGEHGGRAEAANAPGGGAVFTLRLPLSAVPGPHPTVAVRGADRA